MQLGSINPPNYLPYPENDKDILDLICQAYEKERSSMWMSVAEIIPSMGWHLNMQELHRLENLLLISDLFYDKPKGYYKALQLSNHGRKVLHSYKLYSKYQDSLHPPESEEDKILKYLENSDNTWNDPTDVFEKLNIDERLMKSILPSLNDKIDTTDAVGNEIPIAISISDAGRRHLRSGTTSSPVTLKVETHNYNGDVIKDSFNDNKGNINHSSSAGTGLAQNVITPTAESENLTDIKKSKNDWFSKLLWPLIIALVAVLWELWIKKYFK